MDFVYFWSSGSARNLPTKKSAFSSRKTIQKTEKESDAHLQQRDDVRHGPSSIWERWLRNRGWICKKICANCFRKFVSCSNETLWLTTNVLPCWRQIERMLIGCPRCRFWFSCPLANRSSTSNWMLFSFGANTLVPNFWTWEAINNGVAQKHWSDFFSALASWWKTYQLL